MDGPRNLLSQKLVVLLALAAVLAAFSAASAAGQKAVPVSSASSLTVDQSGKDIKGTLADMKDTSMASSMLSATGFDMIVSTGSHTVFVPSDAAIKATGMDMGKVTKVLGTKPVAIKIAQGFVADGSLMPSDLSDGRTLTMMNGQKMAIKVVNGQPTIEGAKISRAVKTSNGVIYVVDTMPVSVMTALSAMGALKK